MTKCGLIILMCFVFTCGCALLDGPETTVEQRPAPALAVGSEVVAADAALQAPAVDAKISTRNLTRDDIRRMQVLLREVGFEPGPADGFA
jgi:hypothetical protein